MLPRIHRCGAWCGVGFLLAYLLGLWVLADFVPAHSPNASAGEIAEIYRLHNARIKLGMDLVMIAASLYLPWVVTWSAMIRRMEGTETFLSKCQMLGGLASSMFFVLPALVWQVAAYRIDRPPSEIRMLNDFGWILTVTPVPPFLIQFLPFAVAILLQKAYPGCCRGGSATRACGLAFCTRPRWRRISSRTARLRGMGCSHSGFRCARS